MTGVVSVGWGLWGLAQRRLAGYLLVIDFLAVGGVAGCLVLVPISGNDIVPLILLTGCAILYTELSLPIERVQQRPRGGTSIDLNSVWMFAAVLVLHPALSAVVIAVSYFSIWLRLRSNELYRRVFSVAATIIAGFAAVAFMRLLSPVPFEQMPRNAATFGAVAAAAAVFLLVNTALIVIAIYLGSRNERLRDGLGDMPDYGLEAATVALGILLAWALVDWPVTVLLIIGITLVLHRSALVRQLRDQARADPKTGLLNSESWSADATAELDGAALLMLDLDHFKRINDRHGHLVGDRHLREVADVMKAEVRSTDIVGRFGGEEFVILLPNTTQSDAVATAERIRRQVSTVHIEGAEMVTVSVGVAAHPHHGTTLEEIINAADTALLAAKTAGRNRTLLFTS